MSTLATAAPPTRQSPVLRIVGFSLLLVVALAVAVLLYFYWVAASALPQLDGTLRVKGLSAAVSVTRDGHGVPTIEAQTPEDLFVAQGYVTAQDRLWQMDAMRRFAGGELSQILGKDLIKHDREQRILGLRSVARDAVARLQTQDRAYFEAYARGVNAFIAERRDHLPIEFRILKYSPAPWTPEDSIVIANQMVKDLNHGQSSDALAREKIIARLGPELTNDLYVNRSWRDRPPTVKHEHLDEQSNAAGSDDEEDGDDDAGSDNSVTRQRWPLDSGHEWQDPVPVNGSNNWVISGAHSVTGKPLLSNDMHLGHQMPNLWYEAHLKTNGIDVAGVTLPGMPYVIVGHNQKIAWGFTNVGPTVEDVFIENFNDRDQYQTPDGWMKLQHRFEVIHVKDGADVTVDVQLTRHGPVVTELVPGEQRKLTLRWTLYEGLRMPFFEVDSARNWDEFRHAFAQLDAPGQNVVYADVDGNIGYQTTGRIPIRAAGDGSLPVDGTNNAHEWTGYIPFEKLPSVYNPPWGVIATANGRITPDDYPYSVSAEWEAPWRTARIYHVLESGRKFSAADMLSLQNDIQSESELFSAEHFVYAVDHAAKPSSRVKQAADIMRNWDGRMLASSAAPTIANRARRELTRLLLEPRLGAASDDPKKRLEMLNWQTYSWQMRSVWLQNVVLHQPKRWLPANYPNYDELLAAAVDAAVSTPGAPKDLSLWRWGSFNAIEIQHPVLGQIPGLRHWTGTGVREQSGSGYSVKAVSSTHGPSERFTANLADLDQSTLNLVTGQAGGFLSPYYMDQWKAWYEGTTFVLPFSAPAVEAAKANRLRLEPAK